MSEHVNPLDRDPVAKPPEWNQDLQQKYQELPLPTLYDCILAQEKLAAEVRKQNKEVQLCTGVMRLVQENIVSLTDSHNSLQGEIEKCLSPLDLLMNSDDEDFLDEEEDDEEFLGEDEDDKDEALNSFFEEEGNVLMQALDSLLLLTSAAEGTKTAILDLLPSSVGFWQRTPPLWRTQTEQILNGYVQGVMTVHDKLLTSLADLGINVIIPEQGSPFHPNQHRAIQTMSGGPELHVAKVIRYGYIKNGNLLRCADVAIYK